MTVLFGAIMSWLGDSHIGSEVGDDAQKSGASIIVIDLGKMAPIDEIQAHVAEVVRYVKDTPPREGASEVLYPGEIEARTRQERLAKGVFIEQSTWDQVIELIKQHGLQDALGSLL